MFLQKFVLAETIHSALKHMTLEDMYSISNLMDEKFRFEPEWSEKHLPHGMIF